MNNEIKEIIECLKIALDSESYEVLLNYITNLQQENKQLKEVLNCKEYFSSTMPEDTEFVILTKNNYDRQQKDIQLELIEYKNRIDKAIEYIKNNKEKQYGYNYEYGLTDKNIGDLLNILQNGSDSND